MLQNEDPLNLINQIIKIGLNKIVFTDLGRIGTTEPLNIRLIKNIITKKIDLYVGGGIKKSNTYKLQKIGAKGALVELSDIIKDIESK